MLRYWKGNLTLQNLKAEVAEGVGEVIIKETAEYNLAKQPPAELVLKQKEQNVMLTHR